MEPAGSGRAPKALVVTDPMCSWCWGMTPQIVRAMEHFGDRLEFGLLMGGINTHGSLPIGEFGRRHLLNLWGEVQATTGQSFGFKLPDEFIYNSTLSCMAVVAMGEWRGNPAFEYLHHLQHLFFDLGTNINDVSVLAAAAADCGWSEAELITALEQQKTRELTEFEFATSRVYGTNALPSVLWERDGERGLVAGGYLDEEMLVSLLEARLLTGPE